MHVVTHNEAKSRTLQNKDYRSIVRSYFGTVLESHPGPQVFLVDMPDEGSTIHPHFHDIDQFQVIVRGGGRLGPGQAQPFAFHYADAYTPYGPIVGGKDGVSFYTVRAACSMGFFPMPEARNKLKTKPGRNIAGLFETGKPLPAAGQHARDTLLEDKADNMLVVGLRMGANAKAEGVAPTGGDQFYLVCTGSLAMDGRDLPPLTMIRVTPGESAPALAAGPHGAELLIMQLPRPTERIGSDPAELARREGSYDMPESMRQ